MIEWLSPDVLEQHVAKLEAAARRAYEEAGERRARNVVDPFSSLLIAATQGVQSADNLVEIQKAESALRGMSNALGTFHQDILGSVDGWHNHDAGYDLECPSRCILAEVKNKWNTMNATNRRKVEDELEIAVRQKSGRWEGYLVFIVPKQPVRMTWEIAPRVFGTDGVSFYHKVTGDPNALHDLFDHVCAALAPSDAIAGHCREIMAASLPPRENP